MLDRMSLSMKNGWLDEENRAYIIYTLDNVMEDLGCANATCVKMMKELDSDNGIGLSEKKRRGLGKPDIIYVKNFATDVYKRQEQTGCDGFMIARGAQGNPWIFRQILHYFETGEHLQKPPASEVAQMIPVSYTHLTGHNNFF